MQSVTLHHTDADVMTDVLLYSALDKDCVLAVGNNSLWFRDQMFRRLDTVGHVPRCTDSDQKLGAEPTQPIWRACKTSSILHMLGRMSRHRLKLTPP